MTDFIKIILSNVIFYQVTIFLTFSISIIYILSLFIDNISLKDITILNLSFLGIYIISNILLKSYHDVFLIFPIFIFLKYKNKNNLLATSIFTVLYYILLKNIINFIVQLIFYFLKLDPIYWRICSGILIIFVIILTTKHAKKIFVKIITIFSLYKLYSFILLILTIFILSIYTFIDIYDSLNGKHTLSYYIGIVGIIVQCSIFSLIVFFLLKNIRTEMNAKLKIIEAEQYAKHIENLEKNNIEVRKFKHDFSNIMLSLSGYINSEELNINELRDYFNKQISPININLKHDENIFFEVNKIKNKPIRSLILNKIFIAQNNNIKVKINIIDNININVPSELDLTRILGILLDNSIEECKNLEYNKKLEITFLVVKNTIDIIISNTFDGRFINIKQIKEQGYSSKGENRGLGLSIAGDLVRKNRLFLNTNIKNNIFSQILTIEGDYYETNNM